MKKNFSIAVLLLLIVFHMLNIISWFNQGLWPTGKDWHMHLKHAYTLIENLKSGFSWNNFIFVNTSHPPFFYWTGMFLRKLCLYSNRSIFLTPALFFFILVLSVYGIGKKLFNKEVGLVAAIICSFSPIIYQSSVQFHVDLAAAAMVSLTNYLIITSNGFANRRNAFFIGIVLGLTLLTRQFVILFIAGPFFAALFKSLERKKMNLSKVPKDTIINSVIVISIGLLMAFCYYLRPNVVHRILNRFNTPGEAGGGSVLGIRHLSFYLRGISWQIGFLGMGLFVIGMYNLLKSWRFKGAVLFSWFIVPFIVATLTQLKFIEYTMSYVPALILIGMFSFENIKNFRFKNGLMLFWVIFNMCQYFREF